MNTRRVCIARTPGGIRAYNTCDNTTHTPPDVSLERRARSTSKQAVQTARIVRTETPPRTEARAHGRVMIPLDLDPRRRSRRPLIIIIIANRLYAYTRTSRNPGRRRRFWPRLYATRFTRVHGFSISGDKTTSRQTQVHGTLTVRRGGGGSKSSPIPRSILSLRTT